MANTIYVPGAVEDYLAIQTLVAEGSYGPVNLTYRGRSLGIEASEADLRSMLRDLDAIAAGDFFDAAPRYVRAASKVAADRIRRALEGGSP